MKKLYRADIYHKRYLPKVNEFNYTGYYIKFDIDRIHDLEGPIFGINTFNLFSFYTRDHGYRDSRSLKLWAQDILKKSGINDFDGKIILQTFPRVMGMVFNPVSFWYCYQERELSYIICEVNNTFGETHSYLLKGDLLGKKVSLPKEFHVSPFYDVSGSYDFSFNENNKVVIDLIDNNKKQITTSISGKEIAWNSSNLLKLFLRYPFYSVLILGLIHFQALRLFLKKNKFYPKPEKNSKEVTYEY